MLAISQIMTSFDVIKFYQLTSLQTYLLYFDLLSWITMDSLIYMPENIANICHIGAPGGNCDIFEGMSSAIPLCKSYLCHAISKILCAEIRKFLHNISVRGRIKTPFDAHQLFFTMAVCRPYHETTASISDNELKTSGLKVFVMSSPNQVWHPGVNCLSLLSEKNAHRQFKGLPWRILWLPLLKRFTPIGQKQFLRYYTTQLLQPSQRWRAVLRLNFVAWAVAARKWLRMRI